MTKPSSRSGEVVGRKYRLEQLLGQGGMGSVYAARNTATGKRVAIKCLHREVANNSEAAQRFMREAKASARVRHPNVVDVYDIVTEDGALFLVMELLEGEPLSSLMAGPATVLPDFIRILIAAMRGVAAAHREGVIHRDIKPENIFLAREGDAAQIVPKVLDFGISKLYGTQDASLTAPGAALGTALYMSSEQLHGARDLDGRADVYAFGVILYQAVTGRAPFEAETLPALLLRIMTEAPVSVLERRPDAPPRLAQLIEWAMARQRDERLPSIDAFISELTPFGESSGYQHQWTRPFAATTPSAATPEAGSERVVTPAGGARPVPAVAVSGETPFAASSVVPRTASGRSLLVPTIVAVCGLGLAATSGWLLHGARPAPEEQTAPAADRGVQNGASAHAAAAAPLPTKRDRLAHEPQPEPPSAAPSRDARSLPQDRAHVGSTNSQAEQLPQLNATSSSSGQPDQPPQLKGTSTTNARAEQLPQLKAASSANATTNTNAQPTQLKATISANVIDERSKPKLAPDTSTETTRPTTADDPTTRRRPDLSAAAAQQAPTGAPHKAKPAASASKPNTPPRTLAKPNCNPNFILDAEGEKHFKPECF